MSSNLITQAVSGSSNHGRQRRQPARTGVNQRTQPAHLPLFRAPGAAVSIPADRSFAPLAGLSGLPEAIAAAKTGDIAKADRIELVWLNTWGPRPPVERFTDDDRLVIRALRIEHRAGGVIVWGLVWPCGRCSRRVRLDLRCRYCGGEGHLSNDYEMVYTDYDGNEVEA